MEREIFLKNKKYSNIKSNSTSALPIIQDILKSMKFELDRKVNYDPKKVISERKASYRIGSFEHQNDEELAAKANVEYTEQNLEEYNSEKRKEKEPETQILGETSSVFPTPLKNETSLKRPLTDVTEMEVDVPNKKAKFYAYDKQIITLEYYEELSINQL